MNNGYIFDENKVFDTISADWRVFMTTVRAKKCVVGISGGIDSTCVAALACKIFGRENVIGISLPCDGQRDIVDVDKVFNHLNIRRLNFDIGDAFVSIINGIENSAFDVSEVTRTNLPARLRMTSLYAFAQSIPDAIVINTCNLSESLMGYDTLWGDDCGSYAPIQRLTKTEVRKLARWLGVPEDLVMKTPIDGLQTQSDEERFGFTYGELDGFIREGIAPINVMRMILKRYQDSKFKLDMVHIQGPEFNFPNHIQMRNT